MADNHTNILQVQSDVDDDEVRNLSCGQRFCHWVEDHLVFTQASLFVKVWNIILALLLLYTGTIFPYRLCFIVLNIGTINLPEEELPTEAAWDVIDVIVDILFYFDLVINFFISFRTDDGAEITSPGAIAQNYLYGYFLMNVVACIPPELVDVFVKAVMSETSHKLNQGMRIAKLQRVSRLARLARLPLLTKLIRRVLRHPWWTVLQNLRFVRVCNFVFFLFWAVHLVACGWYLTAVLHKDSYKEETDTWVQRRGLLGEDPVDQWFHAMYFVLTVFTTVGFGDISAFTMGEIMYVSFTMIVGAVVHSITMSEMINVVVGVDQADQDLEKQHQLVLGFAEHAGMASNVSRELADFLSQSVSRLTDADRSKLRNLLTGSSMPPRMIKEMVRGAFNGGLEGNKFITTCLRYEKMMASHFPLLLALVVAPRHFLARENVYHAYEPAWNVFIVMKGTFAYVAYPTPMGGSSDVPERAADKQGAAQSQHSHSKPKEVAAAHVSYPFQLFGRGSYFGDLELLLASTTGRPRLSGARCEGGEGCAVLILRGEELQKLCNEFPRFDKAWRAAARRREDRRVHQQSVLTYGRSYQHFAAEAIQRHVRRVFHFAVPRSTVARELSAKQRLHRRRKMTMASRPVPLAEVKALREEMLEGLAEVRELLLEAVTTLSPSEADRVVRAQAAAAAAAAALPPLALHGEETPGGGGGPAGSDSGRALGSDGGVAAAAQRKPKSTGPAPGLGFSS